MPHENRNSRPDITTVFHDDFGRIVRVRVLQRTGLMQNFIVHKWRNEDQTAYSFVATFSTIDEAKDILFNLDEPQAAEAI